jgi:hypothetical protein
MEDTIQIELESKYAQKLASFKSLTDDELKQIAKDIYNVDIYTDRHCQAHEITQSFMILMLMGPNGESSNDETSGKRDSKILEREIEQKYYNEYLNQIGLVYEYWDKRSPMGINGKPIFMSCHFLSKEDTEKMFGFYETYIELRKNVDNF